MSLTKSLFLSKIPHYQMGAMLRSSCGHLGGSKGKTDHRPVTTGPGTEWGCLTVLTLHFFPPPQASFYELHGTLGVPRWQQGAPGLRQSTVLWMSCQQAGLCCRDPACWGTRVSSSRRVPPAAHALSSLSAGAFTQNCLHQRKRIPTSWPGIGRGWVL